MSNFDNDLDPNLRFTVKRDEQDEQHQRDVLRTLVAEELELDESDVHVNVWTEAPDDWQHPVYVSYNEPRLYDGVCDLAVGTVAEQARFIAEQARLG